MSRNLMQWDILSKSKDVPKKLIFHVKLLNKVNQFLPLSFGFTFLKWYDCFLVGWLFEFYGISTIVGYLTTNPFYKIIQFYFKLFSLT